MALLTAGRSAKQIAGQLGVSAVTARDHRSHIKHKMGARSVADLVRMADKPDGPSPLTAVRLNEAKVEHFLKSIPAAKAQ
jgi:hypothetical protein